MLEFYFIYLWGRRSVDIAFKSNNLEVTVSVSCILGWGFGIGIVAGICSADKIKSGLDDRFDIVFSALYLDDLVDETNWVYL